MRDIVKLATAAIFGALVFTTPTEAHAGIPYVWGEHVSHVADLPEDDRLKIGGKAASLGFEHEYISIAWLPLWGSTDGAYVLYSKDGRQTQYRHLTDEQAEALTGAIGIEYAGPTPFSKLSMVWGLAIMVPMVGFGVYGKATGRA